MRRFLEDENDMTYAIERVIDEAVRDGEAQGEARGEARGGARGEARKAFETARAMIKYGDPIEKAALITGIPVDELRRRIGAPDVPQ
jgi:predicted transposase YdaD